MIPRWCHRIYAGFMGYFWTECPVCRRMFGGHEWRDLDGLPAHVPESYGSSTGTAICPRCTAEGYGFTQWGFTS